MHAESTACSPDLAWGKHIERRSRARVVGNVYETTRNYWKSPRIGDMTGLETGKRGDKDSRTTTREARFPSLDFVWPIHPALSVSRLDSLLLFSRKQIPQVLACLNGRVDDAALAGVTDKEATL
jgi:hypothetical protein